ARRMHRAAASRTAPRHGREGDRAVLRTTYPGKDGDRSIIPGPRDGRAAVCPHGDGVHTGGSRLHSLRGTGACGTVRPRRLTGGDSPSSHAPGSLIDDRGALSELFGIHVRAELEHGDSVLLEGLEDI